MEILRKILRAILIDDGAPSIFSGLAIGQPVHHHAAHPVSAAPKERKDRTPAQRSVRPF
jgi:hypothetical protein